MIYKLLKNILLITMAIIIAGFFDVTVSRIGFPPFGGGVGGLLIGLYFKNREVLYGAFVGLFYIILSFVVSIAIGIGIKLTIKETLDTLFLSIRAVDFLKMFSIMAFFIFGAWLGRLLKKKRWR